MKKILALFLLLASQLSSAYATAVITGVSYTDKSITFTATGDLSGYAVPSGEPQEFSILYTGNLFTSSHFEANQLSNDIFSNGSNAFGNTGGFGSGINYTWNSFTFAGIPTFTGAPVTVSWNSAMLNPTGTGVISFLWGNPFVQSYTVVQSFSVVNGSIAAVPEPETYAMLLAGLGLMGFVARRHKSKA